MEKNNVKRIPVMRDGKVTSIVTRSNLLQAARDLARHTPDPTADDDHIHKRIIQTNEKSDWHPLGLVVIVRDGVVNLTSLLMSALDKRLSSRRKIFSGVKQVHDHLCWVDIMSGSGAWIEAPEDKKSGANQ